MTTRPHTQRMRTDAATPTLILSNKIQIQYTLRRVIERSQRINSNCFRNHASGVVTESKCAEKIIVIVMGLIGGLLAWVVGVRCMLMHGT